ncbi:MAG: glycerol-3-phosphate acyltransferase, partial [Bacteroidota bacterium]
MGLKLTAVILAYLVGSIPTSVWLGKYLFHTDIREHGSGNAGFTNALRVLGPRVGIPVLLFDVFKGWIAVNLVRYFGLYIAGSPDYIKFQLLLGIIAVIGHIFPVYVGF